MERLEITDFFSLERACAERGWLLAGVDEAGRGPLAGPVVAAAVILPAGQHIQGVNDSKKISEKKRERLYEEIVSSAIGWAVGVIDAQRIDEVNILNADKEAVRQAVKELFPVPDVIYHDEIPHLELPISSFSIVKGDALVYSIAAASIVAKVTRDRLMRQYDEIYPGYGFAKHKGYGTRAHYEAIDTLGVLPIHRRSFLKGRI